MTKLVTDIGLQKALELVGDKINNPLPVSIEYPNNTAQVGVDATGTKYDMIESPESTIELNGRTLVNLWGSKVNDFIRAYCEWSNGIGTMTADGEHHIQLFSKKPEMFKPNTEYTIFFNVLENTIVDAKISINDNYDAMSVFDNIYLSNNATGLQIIKAITISDFSNVKYGLRTQIAKSITSGTLKFQCIILEGDYTNVPVEYFEELKSAGETEDIEVKSTGKNLFKLSEEKIFAKGTGCYNMPIGSDLTKASSPETVECVFEGDNLTLNTTVQWTGCKIEFPLIPNTQYAFTFDFIDTASLFRSSIYEVNSNYTVTRIIDNIMYNSTKVTDGTYKHTFTTSSNATKGVFAINRGGTTGTTNESNTIIVSNIQLEKGTEVTPYEPYKESITTLPNIEPLRSLPNGVCDEAFIHDDKLVITRNLGEITLNGSESWRKTDGGITDGTDLTTSYFATETYDGLFFGGQENSICDKFLYKNIWAIDVEGFSITSLTTNIRARVLNSRLSNTNVASFIEWLKANNMKIVGKLQVPTYEWYELPSPHLYKDGNIFVETGAIPLTSNSHDINVSLRSAINTNVEEIIEIKEELNTLDAEIATSEELLDLWQGIYEGVNE